MAGANYMGGRRNAAKARSRDKTGRIQKDFFGRRRLNILSKGLAAAPRSREVVTGGSVLATHAPIELGHAKKATVIQEESVSVLGKRKCDQSDIQTSSSSPRSRRSAQIGSSSTRSTKSRLIQELDILEPHAAMSCILAMDDLAGLRSSPRKQWHSDSSPRSRSPVSSCGDDSVVNEEEDEIVEYESVSEFRYQSSISTGSGSPSGSRIIRQHRRSDDLLLQDVLETEYMRSVDYDQDQTSSTGAFKNAHTFTSRGCSSVSLLAQVSSAGHEDELSSFLSVPLSEGISAHRTSKCDRKTKRFVNDVPGGSSADAQLIDPDVGIQTEICHNLLDYSDPWEQIGIIMGLQENHFSPSNGGRIAFANKEECNTAEDEQEIKNPAAVESDLPPSDIIDESSWDDILWSPSSLPMAESSESMKAHLESTAVFPQVDAEDIWEVEFDDWAFGLEGSRFDDAAPHAVDGSVLDVFECGDGQESAPSRKGEQYPVHDAKRGDAAGSHPSPVKRARSTDSPGVVDFGMESGDVLAIPELMACNGVYQGPCLSQDSAHDE
ncbi:hypothetical protein AGABI2DRAFT_116000 [Agaricus bisporus var. bisporus H97]|uniref:hypothetical protein n=1 Tax=Agaricus bisporus var. bisporus (strain H97 / ATCC MYA-4626 / FGSC 10389) TaxID=936046 RepID=UPI00029F587E|nr:hypothetical protein AGABI2DRAFT_116000 [Agaricus bisporus var. bisporus H97]EKV48955.1 hypothetical protein AGABI2DRAFT_116000 [Agaricus bisporus var. bisporus H97]